MPVDKSTLARWHALSAAEVLIVLADHAKCDRSYVPVKCLRSTRWHARMGDREFELVLTGPKFWDTRKNVGGGGAIDLAMHLGAIGFAEATKLLQHKGL